MDSLTTLRAAISTKIVPELRDGSDNTIDDITKAETLHFSPVPGVSDQETTLQLNAETRFESKDATSNFIDLRTVYNCWITKDLNVTDYINISAERNIKNLKFLERTDLLTWLEGASNESDNIKPLPSGVPTTKRATTTAVAVEPEPKKKRIMDPLLQQIYDQERTLVDHNTALRGNKMIDFTAVSNECRDKIIMPFKKNGSARKSTATSAAPGSSSASSKKHKEPIILLSPSASALLNMSNAKEFFENGVYNSQTMSSGVANLQFISRSSPRIGNVRFVVVDSVEKFKPAYWDRVVAVFVTGQPWQLKPYKWSDPDTLFQRVLGFALVFKGDPLPPTLNQWNVDVIQVDRTQRFRDRELVEKIWDKLEQFLTKRGYPVRR